MPLAPPTAGPAPNEPGVSAVGSGGGPVQLPAAKPGKGTAPVTVLFTVQPWGAATPMMDDMLCICVREPLSALLLWGQAGLDLILRRTHICKHRGRYTGSSAGHGGAAGAAGILKVLRGFKVIRDRVLGPHVCVDDVHGGRVGQGDLVGVVGAGAHRVQVPEVAALRHAVLQRVVLDLLVHRLVELVPDGVALRHGLACAHIGRCLQDKPWSIKLLGHMTHGRDISRQSRCPNIVQFASEQTLRIFQSINKDASNTLTLKPGEQHVNVTRMRLHGSMCQGAQVGAHPAAAGAAEGQCTAWQRREPCQTPQSQAACPVPAQKAVLA